MRSKQNHSRKQLILSSLCMSMGIQNFSHLKSTLTPEMSATRWMGTSFLLWSPFPFLMALQ